MELKLDLVHSSMFLLDVEANSVFGLNKKNVKNTWTKCLSVKYDEIELVRLHNIASINFIADINCSTVMWSLPSDAQSFR